MTAWNFEEIACYRAGCGEVIVTHTSIANRWRETHETFYCPAGHAQHFTGKSKAEKVREAMQAKVDAEKRRVEFYMSRMRALVDELDEWRSCPYPMCSQSSYRYASSQTLGRHLARFHGSTYPVYPDADDEAVAS